MRKSAEVKCHSYRICVKDTCNLHGSSLWCWPWSSGRAAFVRFLLCEVSHPPLFHTALFGRKPLCIARTWGLRVYVPPPWGWSIYSIIWNSPAQETCLYYHGYLCLYSGLWFSISLHFCCSNCSTFGHWELSQLAFVCLWHTLIIVQFFEHFLTFLAIQNALGSFYDLFKKCMCLFGCIGF